MPAAGPLEAGVAGVARHRRARRVEQRVALVGTLREVRARALDALDRPGLAVDERARRRPSAARTPALEAQDACRRPTVNAWRDSRSASGSPRRDLAMHGGDVHADGRAERAELLLHARRARNVVRGATRHARHRQRVEVERCAPTRCRSRPRGCRSRSSTAGGRSAWPRRGSCWRRDSRRSRRSAGAARAGADAPRVEEVRMVDVEQLRAFE